MDDTPQHKVHLGEDRLRSAWEDLQSSFEGEARHVYASARAVGRARRQVFSDDYNNVRGAWLTAEHATQNLSGEKDTSSSSSSSWWYSWLGRYGLAVLLVLFMAVDRAAEAGLLRSLPSTDSCDDCVPTSGMYSDIGAPDDEGAQFQVYWEERDPDSLRERLRRFFGWQWRGHVRKVHDLDSNAARRMEDSSSSGSSSSSGGHASHPHEAMFFLITALIIGTFVTQVLSFPLFKGLQQSVVLFVVGVVIALIVESAKLNDELAIFGRSFDMWMSIDPHLLLFTLLPPLVTGDAMSIDTTVAKRVAKQCLYLAGPGVFSAAMTTAAFLYGYMKLVGYDWPFLLCLTSGSILCATDPVAVVSLLKELGASPTLTVQIQGESLLNDGTAIVLYTIAFNMLKGENYDVGDIITFLVKMAIYAWGLGCLIGFVFYSWIKLANNKLNHNSSVIQVALTICCAYSSFIIAEGGFHISGVLSTVAAALVLAHKMWPEVVAADSMHTTWHMLEYLGNTVIFFLAGALSGKVMIKIKPTDYLHLLVIYIVITLVRGTLFFSSRPLFKIFHEEKKEVTLADATVMTWGGLRGAIGLALAIQVNQSRANGRISQEDADRVLFYVSGIAALTLVINASSCPALVNYLGITQMPETKRKMLSIVNRQLRDLISKKTKPGRVREELLHVVQEVESHIQVPASRVSMLKQNVAQARRTIKVIAHPDQHVPKAKVVRTKSKDFQVDIDEDGSNDSRKPSSPKPKFKSSPSFVHQQSDKLKRSIATQDDQLLMQDCDSLVTEFYQVKNKYNMIAGERLSAMLMKNVGDVPLQEQENLMVELVTTSSVDAKTQRAVNEAFLALVRAHYWTLIQSSDFCGGEADQALTSITAALSQRTLDLVDFKYIEPFIQASFEETGGAISVEDAQKAAQQKEREKNATALHKFIEGACFSGSIAVVIALNAISTSVEQEVREENDKSLFWLVMELFFTVVFTLEFLIKFADLKCRYFLSGWNVFDFTLVVLGILGCAFSLMVHSYEADESGGSAVPASESRMIRVAQVFRMMRIVRLFRLYRFWIVLKQATGLDEYAMDVAEHMQKAGILINFIRAHMFSQENLVKFFGRRGKADTCEIARCILQSQISVYKAFRHIEIEARKLGKEILEEVSISEENRLVAVECEHFIHKANSDGVISGHEAESLLHPIHEHIKSCLSQIQDSHSGKLGAAGLSTSPGDASSALGQGQSCKIDLDAEAQTIGKGLASEMASEPAQEPPTAPERDVKPMEPISKELSLIDEELESPSRSPSSSKVAQGGAKEKSPEGGLKAGSPSGGEKSATTKKFGGAKKKTFNKKATLQEEETKQLLGETSSNEKPKKIDKAATEDDLGTTGERKSKAKAKGKARPRWRKDKTDDADSPAKNEEKGNAKTQPDVNV